MYRLVREKTCVMRGEKCDYRGDVVAFPIRRRILRSIMAFSASGLLLARSICVSTMPGAGSDDPNAAGPQLP